MSVAKYIWEKTLKFSQKSLSVSIPGVLTIYPSAAAQRAMAGHTKGTDFQGNWFYHKEKRKDLKGQFVYAALLDINGEHYIAAIKLDDTAADNRAYFKDISIKKRSLYVGQTQDYSLGFVDPSADRSLTIQQLIDFVKQDFSISPSLSRNAGNWNNKK